MNPKSSDASNAKNPNSSNEVLQGTNTETKYTEEPASFLSPVTIPVTEKEKMNGEEQKEASEGNSPGHAPLQEDFSVH